MSKQITNIRQLVMGMLDTDVTDQDMNVAKELKNVVLDEKAGSIKRLGDFTEAFALSSLNNFDILDLKYYIRNADNQYLVILVSKAGSQYLKLFGVTSDAGTFALTSDDYSFTVSAESSINHAGIVVTGNTLRVFVNETHKALIYLDEKKSFFESATEYELYDGFYLENAKISSNEITLDNFAVGSTAISGSEVATFKSYRISAEYDNVQDGELFAQSVGTQTATQNETSFDIYVTPKPRLTAINIWRDVSQTFESARDTYQHLTRLPVSSYQSRSIENSQVFEAESFRPRTSYHGAGVTHEDMDAADQWQTGKPYIREFYALVKKDGVTGSLWNGSERNIGIHWHDQNGDSWVETILTTNQYKIVNGTFWAITPVTGDHVNDDEFVAKFTGYTLESASIQTIGCGRLDPNDGHYDYTWQGWVVTPNAYPEWLIADMNAGNDYDAGNYIVTTGIKLAFLPGEYSFAIDGLVGWTLESSWYENTTSTPESVVIDNGRHWIKTDLDVWDIPDSTFDAPNTLPEKKRISLLMSSSQTITWTKQADGRYKYTFTDEQNELFNSGKFYTDSTNLNTNSYPKFADAVVFNNRLFVASENTIRWSEPYKYDSFKPENEYTGKFAFASLVQFRDLLFGFTQYDLTIFNYGGLTSTWRVSDTIGDIGTTYKRSIVSTPVGVIFANKSGVYMVGSQAQMGKQSYNEFQRIDEGIRESFSIASEGVDDVVAYYDPKFSRYVLHNRISGDFWLFSLTQRGWIKQSSYYSGFMHPVNVSDGYVYALQKGVDMRLIKLDTSWDNDQQIVVETGWITMNEPNVWKKIKKVYALIKLKATVQYDPEESDGEGEEGGASA